MTITDLGARRTSRDMVEVESWRGIAAALSSSALIADVALHTISRQDGGNYPTIRHGATRRYHALFISWVVLTEAGASRPHQPHPQLVTSAVPLIPQADWEALQLLWSDWHAQALSPGCIHQDPPPASSVAAQLRAVPRCEHDGYRYGSAWLVRETPLDIRQRARQVGSALQRVGATA